MELPLDIPTPQKKIFTYFFMRFEFIFDSKKMKVV